MADQVAETASRGPHRPMRLLFIIKQGFFETPDYSSRMSGQQVLT
jgi:hypothetical protein